MQKCRKRDILYCPKILVPTFCLLSPISAVVQQQINSLEASNSHRSFLNLGKLSKIPASDFVASDKHFKFLRSESDGGEPAQEFVT